MSVFYQDDDAIERFPTLYRVNGLRYDRLSAVLDIIAKPQLDAWRRKHGFEEADRLLAEAGERGTRVHAICEQICLDNDPWPAFVMGETWIQIQGTELEPYYTSYLAWHREHIRRVILTERVLWSDELEVAGTFDLLAELYDGGVALLDFKTSRYLSWVYRLQCSFYREVALDQLLVPEIPVRGIIHLSSKTEGKTCILRKYPDHELAFRRLTAAIELHRASMEWADDWR